MKLFIHLYPVICLPAPLRTTTGPGPAYGSTARPTGLRAYGPGPWLTGPPTGLRARALGLRYGLYRPTGLRALRAHGPGLRAYGPGPGASQGSMAVYIYIYISRYHWWGDMDFMEFHQQCTDRNDASTWS